MMLVGDSGIDVVVLGALPDLPGLPDEYKARGKADALMIPEGYMGVTSEYVRTHLINIRWNRVVTVDRQGRLRHREPIGGFSFVSASPLDMMYFPLNDPRQPGRPRYDWYHDAADSGVRYGFLRA